MEQAKS